MNREQKNLISLILSFTLLTSVSAKNIEIEDILSDLEVIQVGAFKERKNILNQNQHFSNYNTFIEYGDYFNRLYIVNIKKSDFFQILSEVKKNNSSAFNASKKIRKIIKNYRLMHNKVPYAEVPEKFTNDSGFLNSKTILKTRKKFF